MMYYKKKNPDLKTKKINKERIIYIAILIILVLSTIVLMVTYRMNENFRDFLDYTILRKEISNENTVKINLTQDNISNIYAYNKNIVILTKNQMQVYNNLGKLEKEMEITISNPIFEDNNRFLTIGERGGNKLYLINGDNIVWQKDLEGEISKINVNKNGYVTVSISNTGYKTIIILFAPSGEELFKTYLPTTYALDIETSNDNKYLSIAEVSTTGTIIQTDIRVISIENAKNNPDEAFIATYNAASKDIITNIKYHDKNNLISMYDTGVFNTNESMKKLKEINNDTIFVDIESPNHIVSVEKTSGSILKANYAMKIFNILTEKTIEYQLSNLPKAVYIKNNIVAINYGSEVEFVSTNAWLIKKYKTKQDMKNIVLADGIAGVVYKDKIEIIEL